MDCMAYEGPLVAVSSEFMRDWYTIEKAEHENIEEIRRVSENVSSLFLSARISDACVEGPDYEIREMAQAILEGTDYYAKRCAVRIDGDYAYFCSPRNSRVEGRVPLERAVELAEEILRTIPKASRFMDEEEMPTHQITPTPGTVI